MPTSGMIITSDGSHYNPPPAKATNEEYVPLAFAKGKVAEVVNELKATKESYSKYINDLQNSHNAAMESTKSHYEGYIIEVRGKAKRHIGIQLHLTSYIAKKSNFVGVLTIRLTEADEGRE